MTRVSLIEQRVPPADAFDLIADGERVILQRDGEDMAALIPLSDLALLQELEDRSDLEAARAALAESEERIPYEQIRRELGLVEEVTEASGDLSD